jgi:hypothetical protein
MFPKPLDWALLWRTITIASEGGQRRSIELSDPPAI